MENAVEALKLGFAVLVFVLALTLSINLFNQAKATSDAILQTEDETTYYDYYNYTDEYAEEGSSRQYEKRVVGLETVIPTLYKYYKENYTVVFQVGNYTDGELSNVEKMVIYESQSPYWSDMLHKNGKVLWGNYDWTKYWPGVANSSDKIYDICSFDIDEETKRHEVWSGKTSDAKANLDCFIGGGTFVSPNGNTDYDMNYGQSFVRRLNNKYGTGNNPQFVEELGEYAYDKNSDGNTEISDTTIEIDGEVTSILRENKKRVITYTLIKN